MVDKAHILDEIQRTAKTNGGTPLGHRRFAKETGIREHDWLRYWARWGDAQREAGLAPNARTIGYGDELLIQKLVDLIRELGKFPTNRELRLKRATDAEFPSEMAYRRFGGTERLAALVAEYCQRHPGFDDVAQLCAVGIQGRSSPAQALEDGPGVQFGFVYLLRSGRYYKIGMTNAVGRRERELAIQLPERAAVVHSIKTDDPSGIEDYWHRRFAAKRQNGEWFSLSTADVQAFKRRKFM
jgi:hypothetical protein